LGRSRGTPRRLRFAQIGLALGFAGCLAVTPTPAPAASDDAKAGSAAAKYRRVESSCRTEAAAFCVWTTRVTYPGRDQAYCLKPHRQDLSLGCRGAVVAALK
jgi:hypothetical protein